MQAYLSFDGKAAEALAFYATCLDGKVTSSMTWGDSPMAADMPPEARGRIMHATLEANGQTLMAADMPPGTPFAGHTGFSLSVQRKDAAAGKAVFDKLAEGGKVTMPYGETFWAKGFGMLEDRFGVPWMVNCEH